MRSLRVLRALIVTLASFAGVGCLHAAFHLWQVKEVFTNATGTVQFVEMFDGSSGENSVGGKTLRAVADGVTKNFVFPADIPAAKPTAGRSLLIATSAFGSLPGGVTPDYIIQNGGVTVPFFNPNAANISISFLGSGSSMTFTGAQLPKDGIHSINSPTTSAVNSPKNIDNGSGSVIPPTGDYNGDHTVDAADYVLWRNTISQAISPAGIGADGNASGLIDNPDFVFWKARFGNAVPGAGAGIGSLAVPEPVTPTTMMAGLFLLAFRRRR
jgi:hypothetical protein